MCVGRRTESLLEIESPQHWCRESIEKLAPWVWLMQSVVSLKAEELTVDRIRGLEVSPHRESLSRQRQNRMLGLPAQPHVR